MADDANPELIGPQLDNDDIAMYEGAWSAHAALHRVVRRLEGALPEGTLLKAWEHAAFLENPTASDVMEAIVRVRKLVSQARVEANSLRAAQRDRSNELWPGIEHMLNTPNLEQQWRHASANMGAGTSATLLANHGHLHGNLPLIIGKEYLTELRCKVIRLQAQLEKDSTVPRDVQLLLLRMLQGIVDAINDYKWAGPEGIRRRLVEFDVQLADNANAIEANLSNPVVAEVVTVTIPMQEGFDQSRRNFLFRALRSTAIGAGVLGTGYLEGLGQAHYQKMFPSAKDLKLPPAPAAPTPLPASSPTPPQIQSPQMIKAEQDDIPEAEYEIVDDETAPPDDEAGQ